MSGRLGRVLVLLGIVGGCGFQPGGPAAIDGPPPIDACVPDPLGERCNGTDDDCDLMVDEAFPTLGEACDGDDADGCVDDALACNPAGDGTTCANRTPDAIERCNGADDDCDTAVDEDIAMLGDACDGDDGDLCPEGVYECDPATGGVRCNDLTPTIVETCNLVDDDCDLATDETFDLTSDPANCGQCGRQCSNSFGTTTCTTSACTPTCSAGANDCDGNPVTGCELRNTDPTCTSGTYLGEVDGDVGSQTLSTTGFGDAYFTVQINEVSFSSTPVLARIRLVSPPGTNFDLFVRCANCTGPLESAETLTGIDSVGIGRNDTDGSGDGFDIVIEVRWISATACGDWMLDVAGNVPTTNRACN
jgi:hypothetical protein